MIVNPAVRLDDKPRHIPHGLAILANVIRNKLNITPAFLDINGNRYKQNQLEKILNGIDFDIVLIGGIASVYKEIVRLSKYIKSINQNSKIIAGGYVAMPLPDVLLKNSEVDIVCTGEGEITTIKLLKRFEKKGLNASIRDIPGICYKNGEKKEIICTKPERLMENLDEQSALPAYDLLPMEIYLSNPTVGLGRDIDFISIRGCPYSCTFCYQPWGHKPRSHSVAFMMKSIKLLKEEYKIDFISFQDDEFIANKKRVIEFCKIRNKYFPDLLWSCTGRANIVSRDEELVRLMKRSGCVLISYGFESGSQRMLESMKKRIKVEQMEKAVEISRKYALPIPASFIIGMPGENKQSCKETLDFCIKNNLPLDSLMFATPYPGAEIFDFALKTGRIRKDKLHEFYLKLGDAREFLINLTDYFSDEELIEKRSYMIKKARDNYENYITTEEIELKTRNLYGKIIDKYDIDDVDFEHRLKHGGISVF